jgi:2-methylcitrate dehydratase
LKAEDVREVRIDTLARAADILSDPSKYDPQSKETADHSLPYCIAAALAEGRVTPELFEEDKIFDPRIRAQLPKIKVKANPEFEAQFPRIQPCRVVIETTDGRTLEHRIEIPKGDPRDPMTEDDLRVKFDALSSPSFSEKRRDQIRRAIFELEKSPRASELMALTVADR